MAAIGAILLAAGASQRFGTENKLLVDLGGQPLVRRVAEEITRSGVTEVLVVTGYDQPSILRALEGMPVRFIHNANWTAGMGASIATGISAVGPEIEGAFIVPGDMPFLTCGLLDSLVVAFDRNRGDRVIVPATPSGEQRNPILWPRRFFPKLNSLSGAEGAKHLLLSVVTESISVTADDAGVFGDVDTRADLQAARALSWSN
jgi:molybdenum cofactor cytidylyltransferase